MEVWKNIEGYEGLYQVSNMGRVKSMERIRIKKDGRKFTVKERVLKPGVTKDGYLIVALHAGDKQKTLTVHRLVCQAFHKNPENKPCVNHIDENKTNNAASNLEWCTYEENNNHGKHNERMAKTRSKPVGQYTRAGELVKIWSSTIEAKRQAGFDCGHISRVANGERKTHKGFIWRYI